jgi:hypothetical protein
MSDVVSLPVGRKKNRTPVGLQEENRKECLQVDDTGPTRGGPVITLPRRNGGTSDGISTYLQVCSHVGQHE